MAVDRARSGKSIVHMTPEKKIYSVPVIVLVSNTTHKPLNLMEDSMGYTGKAPMDCIKA